MQPVGRGGGSAVFVSGDRAKAPPRPTPLELLLGLGVVAKLPIKIGDVSTMSEGFLYVESKGVPQDRANLVQDSQISLARSLARLS